MVAIAARRQICSISGRRAWRKYSPGTIGMADSRPGLYLSTSDQRSYTRRPRRSPAITNGAAAAIMGARTGFSWAARAALPSVASSVPIDAASLRLDGRRQNRRHEHVTRSYSPAGQGIVGAEVRPWPRPADREAHHQVRDVSRYE